MIAFIKRFIVGIANDLALRLIALIVSIIAWLLVAVQVFPETTTHLDNIHVNMDLTNSMKEQGIETVSNTDFNVSVQFRGKRYEIGTLKPEDFTATADLSHVISSGEYWLDVSVAPKNNIECEIISIYPDKIKVSFDKIVSKNFEVVPNSDDINIPEGYFLDDIVITPSTVGLKASENILSIIDRCEVKPIITDSLSESVSVKGELIIYDKNNNRVDNSDILISNNNFNVSVPIYKKKTLPIKISFTDANGFLTSRLNYEITPAEIEIASPNDTLDNMSEINIGIISLSDVRLDYKTTLPIDIPINCKNLSGTSMATVKFNTEGYGQLDFTTKQINITNVPDTYEVTTLTKELNVTVIGDSGVISAMTGDDIIASCNLFGVPLSEGSKSVSVTFYTKKSSVWIVGKYQIVLDVKLKEDIPEE